MKTKLLKLDVQSITQPKLRSMLLELPPSTVIKFHVYGKEVAVTKLEGKDFWRSDDESHHDRVSGILARLLRKKASPNIEIEVPIFQSERVVTMNENNAKETNGLKGMFKTEQVNHISLMNGGPSLLSPHGPIFDYRIRYGGDGWSNESIIEVRLTCEYNQRYVACDLMPSDFLAIFMALLSLRDSDTKSCELINISDGTNSIAVVQNSTDFHKLLMVIEDIMRVYDKSVADMVRSPFVEISDYPIGTKMTYKVQGNTVTAIKIDADLWHTAPGLPTFSTDVLVESMRGDGVSDIEKVGLYA